MTTQQPKHEFRTIQGRPCPKLIAPFIAILINDTRSTINSIYRGADAEAILHKHGLKSQRELYTDFVDKKPGALPANPPGFSTHELKSDGVAYKEVRRGQDLEWWMQGFDVNDSEVVAIENEAKKHGWQLFRPYPSGVEYHHLNFRIEPKPNGLKDRLRVARLRLTLPRS